MVRLNPLDDGDITPEIRENLNKLHVDPVAAPNLLKILAKSLASMRAYADAENALAKGHLTARQRKQIAIAVAEINGAKYFPAAYSRGKDAALSEEDVRLARKAMATDAKSNAMLRLTLSVVLQRGEIKDDDLRLAREGGLSESEIIEVVANVAMNIFTNYLSLISRAEADLPSQSEDGPAVAAPQFRRAALPVGQ